MKSGFELYFFFSTIRSSTKSFVKSILKTVWVYPAFYGSVPSPSSLSPAQSYYIKIGCLYILLKLFKISF